MHVQGWFSDPAHRASGRIDFDKSTQRFDADAAHKACERSLSAARPHDRPIRADRRPRRGGAFRSVLLFIQPERGRRTRAGHLDGPGLSSFNNQGETRTDRCRKSWNPRSFRRCNRTECIRIVHNGRKEIHRLHQGEALRELVHARVIARVKPYQHVFVRHARQARQHLVQNLWTELRRSTGCFHVRSQLHSHVEYALACS